LGVNRERQQLLEQFSELETKEQKDMKPLSTTLVGTGSNCAKQERYGMGCNLRGTKLARTSATELQG